MRKENRIYYFSVEGRQSSGIWNGFSGQLTQNQVQNIQ